MFSYYYAGQEILLLKYEWKLLSNTLVLAFKRVDETILQSDYNSLESS